MIATRGNPPKPTYAQSRFRRQNRLASGLVAFWALNECGGLLARNAVGNPAYDLTIPNLTDFSWANGADGMALKRGTGANANRLTLGTSIVTGTTWSFACRMLFHSVSGDNFGELIGDTAGGKGIFLHQQTGLHIQAFLAAAGSTQSAGVIPTTGYADFVFSCLNGTGTFYINGTPDANTITSVVTQTFTSLIGNTGNEYVSADMECAGIWLGRALTQGDVNDWRSDPHRVVRRPRRTFNKAPGGGSIFRSGILESRTIGRAIVA